MMGMGYELYTVDPEGVVPNPKLEKITGFTSMTKIRELYLGGDYSLTSVEGLANVSSLKKIWINQCYSLITFPAIGHGITDLDDVVLTDNTGMEDYTYLQPMINANTEVTITNCKYNPTREDILAGKVTPDPQP